MVEIFLRKNLTLKEFGVVITNDEESCSELVDEYRPKGLDEKY
jgi:hypothetical protein